MHVQEQGETACLTLQLLCVHLRRCPCSSSIDHFVITHTQDSNTEVKLLDVSAALSTPLQRDCSCSLSVQQSLFSCLGTADSQTVVVLAELSYTALPGMDLSSLLASWVASTPCI